ncbi:unnamed protein product [Effrenium voratum]|uniref:Uncharacterized protein n=1 Tax=Effrenium voratum TaxID=2562239 RepID=A0AA36J4D3_9DINO|nr:unnamed protein product [Effrenium voratum]
MDLQAAPWQALASTTAAPTRGMFGGNSLSGTLIAVGLVAALSGGVFLCMSKARTAKRGVLLGASDSRRSISTDYSAYSSDVEDASSYQERSSDSEGEMPPSPQRPQARAAASMEKDLELQRQQEMERQQARLEEKAA